MADETQFLRKKDGSHIFDVSLRGWVTIIIVATVCGMALLGIEVKEPMYTLVGTVVGYYFGSNNKKQQTST